MEDDELKLSGGILSQIGNCNVYKPIDFNNPEELQKALDRFNNFLKEDVKRIKDYRPQQYAGLLLMYHDDIFKAAYQSDDTYWIGGIDVWKAIDKRAKNLGIYGE
jgi:hypothetical protein